MSGVAPSLFAAVSGQVTKGLPKDVYAKINAAVIAALQAPDTKARFDAQGFDVVANTPEQFGEFLKGEIARWTQVVNTAGIKPD